MHYIDTRYIIIYVRVYLTHSKPDERFEYWVEKTWVNVRWISTTHIMRRLVLIYLTPCVWS